MIRWRRAALQYACETCGAPPGIKCITVGGKRRYEIHQDRSNRASANDWQIVEEDDGRGTRGANPRSDDEW